MLGDATGKHRNQLRAGRGVVPGQGHPPGHGGTQESHRDSHPPPLLIQLPTDPPESQQLPGMTHSLWNDPPTLPTPLLVQPGEQGIAPWQPSTEITLRAQAANVKYLLWWLPLAFHSLGMHSAS